MQERIRKGRSCTDCLCFLVWIIFTAAWVFVSVMAFRYGNTDYLMFGVDYEGNVCGKVFGSQVLWSWEMLSATLPGETTPPNVLEKHSHER